MPTHKPQEKDTPSSSPLKGVVWSSRFAGPLGDLLVRRFMWFQFFT